VLPACRPGEARLLLEARGGPGAAAAGPRSGRPRREWPQGEAPPPPHSSMPPAMLPPCSCVTL